MPGFQKLIGWRGRTRPDISSWPSNQEIEQLRSQLTALIPNGHPAGQIGRSSRNSSKPTSSDGAGFKPPVQRKDNDRKRSSQRGYSGSGQELLPVERVNKVVEHHPDACRRCGTLLHGEDLDPLPHQVIEITPITPLSVPCASR